MASSTTKLSYTLKCGMTMRYAQYSRKNVDPQQTAKLVHDEPWYWILPRIPTAYAEEINAALQERVLALEQQVAQLNNNMIY